MQKYRLVSHPEWPTRHLQSVEVEVRFDDDEISLTFLVDQADELVLPEWRPSARADDLWKTTCFELFLRAHGSQSYFEFNFSPSTEWAAYHFDGYREGRTEQPLTVAPFIDRGNGSNHVVEADVDLSDMPAGILQMGLSAVIEEADGRKSYWALAHPPGAPDFHHDACFALELPAPRRS